MNLFNLLRISIKAISGNKFRSFLSMLGIIIGVAAVIIMMAIGQGSKQSVRANIAKMGTNMINIHPGQGMMGGARLDPSEMQTLKVSDYEAIAGNRRYVTYVSPEVSTGGQVIYGSKNTNTTIYGESPEYLDIKQWEVERGDVFSDEDVNHSAKVCVIGQTIANELFGDDVDPIDKVIRFKSIPFRVVGVLKAKGYNNWGMDQDNVIIAPYTTVMKRLLAQTFLSSIIASAIDEEHSDAAIEELTATLRASHKLKDGEEDNFTIRSQQEMMETMSSTMDTITVILVVAAGFSLLVAGIGIMNIMLVSVTERTREIGLRMSVGARTSDISLQFLIEAVIISLSGGILGIAAGWAGTVVCRSMGLPAAIPLWSIVLSFAVCTVIGVAFGYFPARKAASLDPIQAIRYE